MLIAADYPFLNILWTIIIFFAWVAWIWIVITVLIDIFRRRDIGGWAKAGWVVFVIVLPFLGVLIYLIAEHEGMQERTLEHAKAQRATMDRYVRDTAGGSATEIAKAKELLDSGAITQAEFDAIKARALSQDEAVEAAGLREQAMPQENVEIVRAAYSAINTGAIEAASELYAPDVELRDLQSAPDQPFSVTGAEALGEVWTTWTTAFDVLSADVKQFIDAGDAVIADAHWHGQGKASGVAIDNRQFDVFELLDGKIVRVTLGYRSKAEALEAAGLRE